MKITRRYFKDLAAQEEGRMYPRILSAPVRRGWNRMLGQSIPSKNDLIRELNSNIQFLNERCIAFGFEGILEEDTVEPVRVKVKGK